MIMSNKTIKILAIIIPVIGAIIVAFISVDWSKFDKKPDKQEVYEKLQNLTKEAQVYVLQEPIDNKTLSKVLEQKISATHIRRKINYLRQSTGNIDFSEWEEIAYQIERRYSYGNIYSRAKLANIVCENLEFEIGDTLQIGGHLRKCNTSELDEIIIKLISISKNNSSFLIKVSNDINHIFCSLESEDCEIEIEEGNRFASTQFQFVIIPEYIGFKGGHSNNNKFVSLSILERLNAQKKDTKGKLKDNSFWDYKLPKMKIEEKLNQKYICSPFFDRNELTQQKPPIPEPIQDIDLDVLRACGSIRGKVTKEEFKAFIKRYFIQLKPTFPSEWTGLEQIEIIKLLLQIWVEHDAFNHIFCGEWKDGTIQGLHYWPRYLQLQFENTACYFKSDEEELGEGGVFTIGVKSTDGANKNSKKGYAITQNAIELLKIGNHAFVKCCKDRSNWVEYRPGIYNKLSIVRSKSNKKNIENVIVFKTNKIEDADSYGLLTIYPDATPDSTIEQCKIEEIIQ